MKDKKLQLIEQVLVETDPVKLIKMGAPIDEYSYEALLIYERINHYLTVDKIQQVIYDVFAYCFGPKPKKIIGTFDSYKEIAVKIKEIVD
jgi:hypothetical protein